MKTILPLQLLVAPDLSDPAPLVIYHGRGCSDGFGAALAAHRYFGERAQYLGLDHGDVKVPDDLPAVDGRAVYVLDFAFNPAVMQSLEQRAAKLVVLDHHLSAAQELTGFQCRCGVVHFDMHKSGARLAWEFFHPHAEVPDLIRFVEDRDLWNWQYAQSPAFLAALDMEPMTFERWGELAQLSPQGLEQFMARGQAMDEKFTKLAQDIAESALPIVFNGQQGLMVNAPGVFHSLVGDFLAQKSGTFALMWAVGKGGVIKVGLRSRSGFNCIALAQSMGGGGHAQACGFKLPAHRLSDLLSGNLQGEPLSG